MGRERSYFEESGKGKSRRWTLWEEDNVKTFSIYSASRVTLYHTLRIAYYSLLLYFHVCMLCYHPALLYVVHDTLICYTCCVVCICSFLICFSLQITSVIIYVSHSTSSIIHLYQNSIARVRYLDILVSAPTKFFLYILLLQYVFYVSYFSCFHKISNKPFFTIYISSELNLSNIRKFAIFLLTSSFLDRTELDHVFHFLLSPLLPSLPLLSSL